MLVQPYLFFDGHDFTRLNVRLSTGAASYRFSASSPWGPDVYFSPRGLVVDVGPLFGGEPS